MERVETRRVMISIDVQYLPTSIMRILEFLLKSIPTTSLGWRRVVVDSVGIKDIVTCNLLTLLNDD